MTGCQQGRRRRTAAGGHGRAHESPGPPAPSLAQPVGSFCTGPRCRFPGDRRDVRCGRVRGADRCPSARSRPSGVRSGVPRHGAAPLPTRCWTGEAGTRGTLSLRLRRSGGPGGHAQRAPDARRRSRGAGGPSGRRLQSVPRSRGCRTDASAARASGDAGSVWDGDEALGADCTAQSL